MQRYLKVLKNYAEFSGRTRRQHYWVFIMCSWTLAFLIAFGDGTLNDGKPGLLWSIYSLGILAPTIAVGVRRMHDVDYSGWWILVPIVNLFIALTEGQKGENRFGPDPKAVTESEQVLATVARARAVNSEMRAASARREHIGTFVSENHLGPDPMAATTTRHVLATVTNAPAVASGSSENPFKPEPKSATATESCPATVAGAPTFISEIRAESE